MNEYLDAANGKFEAIKRRFSEVADPRERFAALQEMALLVNEVQLALKWYVMEFPH